MTSELTMTAMPATVLKSGYSAGQHDPAQHGSQDRIDQTAHIDVADLRALGAQGHEPETEGEDRDEDQHAETRIKPDGLGPEGVETLRRDAHAVNQQAAENICTAFRKIGSTLPLSSETEIAE